MWSEWQYLVDVFIIPLENILRWEYHVFFTQRCLTHQASTLSPVGVLGNFTNSSVSLYNLSFVKGRSGQVWKTLKHTNINFPKINVLNFYLWLYGRLDILNVLFSAKHPDVRPSKTNLYVYYWNIFWKIFLILYLFHLRIKLHIYLIWYCT